MAGQMMVSLAFRNHAETVPKSKNRNHAETAMKPMRNHTETADETIERNRETIPIGEGAMVSPLARAIPHSEQADRGSVFAPLALRCAGPLDLANARARQLATTIRETTARESVARNRGARAFARRPNFPAARWLCAETRQKIIKRYPIPFTETSLIRANIDFRILLAYRVNYPSMYRVRPEAEKCSPMHRRCRPEAPPLRRQRRAAR